MIARGRAIGPEAGITWQVGSALPLPVADGSVDVVLCASSLHFLGRAALDDWRRVLKPGGRVGYTLPLRSRFNPSEQFAKLLATDLTLPETVEEAYALAEGFEDVTVTVGTDIVITTARR
ncbi:Methyltransferase domain-containing protein [Asanoa hainanensis]|uniref:Methyltransferase domain-containing protein n=2 Tax=Asanoa hainanensis TaxID=560556 RepID=A0A239PHL4_9ACTN|nr:Methyltransferase domain-containing protein [Asanoa hainanensis]